MKPIFLILLSLGLLAFPQGSSFAADQNLAVWQDTEENRAFEKQLRDLMYVAVNDTRPACFHRKSEKIDVEAQKKFFTKKGWVEYQSYVNQVKRHLDPSGTQRESYASFNDGTKKFFHSYDEYSGFKAIGILGFNDCDQPSGGPMFTLEIAFAPQTPPAAAFVIDTWNARLFFFENPGPLP